MIRIKIHQDTYQIGNYPQTQMETPPLPAHAPRVRERAVTALVA